MRSSRIAWVAVMLFLIAADGALAGSASNSLSWQVSDEKMVFGYIVYRAERREGPFRRVNPDIIRRHRDDTSGGRYQFNDSSLDVGKTYFYFIDAISEHGRKQRLSGVRSKTATAK